MRILTQPARGRPQSTTALPAGSARTPRQGEPRPRIEVAIEYCEPGNYELPARRLARGLREECAEVEIEAQLIPSSGGVFEVKVAGRLVYSKKATRLLPAANEIAYHVRAAVQGARV